jgi:hypothetical protein
LRNSLATVCLTIDTLQYTHINAVICVQCGHILWYNVCAFLRLLSGAGLLMNPSHVSNNDNRSPEELPRELLNAILNMTSQPLPPWSCSCHSAINWGPMCGHCGSTPRADMLQSIPLVPRLQPTPLVQMPQSTALLSMPQPTTLVPMLQSTPLVPMHQSTSLVGQPVSGVPTVRSAQLGCFSPLLSQHSPQAFNMFASPVGMNSTAANNPGSRPVVEC